MSNAKANIKASTPLAILDILFWGRILSWQILINIDNSEEEASEK